MTYSIDEGLLARYPEFCRGVVCVAGADNSRTDTAALSLLLDECIKALKADESVNVGHPRIQAWKDLYRSFPLHDAGKVQPSVASLVRRIKKDAQSRIPFISPLVCISNVTSLAHLVPSGLIDRDKITGDLMLGFADGTEVFEPFGDERAVAPEPGEIVYYDTGSRTVLCRAWNSKGGRATMIDPETRSAVIDVDGLQSVVPREEISAATHEIADLVSRHCGGEIACYLLDKKNPAITLS